MSANIPDNLTLKKLAKSTGFVVTTNAHAHPTLFCWLTEEGEYLYTACDTPGVTERPLSANGGLLSLCNPITAIIDGGFYIDELYCYRHVDGDVRL